MRNDAITGALNTAIEKASDLNYEAMAVLEKALKKAMYDTELTDDYRFTYAERMFQAGRRKCNIATRYFLTRSKKVAAQAKAAKAGK